MIPVRRDQSPRSRLMSAFAPLALGFALVVPSGALAASEQAARSWPSGPAAPGGEFAMNLYREGVFVSQATPYWCIGASMQMMLNMVGGTYDDSRAAQEANMVAARSGAPSQAGPDGSQDAEPAGGPLRGAGSAGWARGLTALGARRYQELAVDTIDAAMRVAVKALRTTRRPVGLIVWRGAHAWVMSGFTATGDPLVDLDYRVTGAYIQDPWYPRVSSIWGPGQKPNSWISIQALKNDFLPRRGVQRHAEQAGKYVLVLPVDPPWPAVRYSRMV